MSHTSRHF